MQRLKILISERELAALEAAARIDLRPIPEQARYLIRTELQRRGLFPEPEPAQETEGQHDRSNI